MTPALEGAWAGALQIGAVRLRLVVRIKRNGSGWSATVDSVDQYAHDIPIDDVAFDGRQVTLTLFKLHGIYRARLDGADKLDGTWTQNGTSTPLLLQKTAAPPVLEPRVQEPKRPLPYDEIEMTVDNPTGHDALACTLTKPRGAGPFAAVALLTGSGRQNRDEALMGHRPFLVLSDAITRKGVAVLRCDDRGIARSTGDFQGATTFDFVGDALAQVAALRARRHRPGARRPAGPFRGRPRGADGGRAVEGRRVHRAAGGDRAAWRGDPSAAGGADLESGGRERCADRRKSGGDAPGLCRHRDGEGRCGGPEQVAGAL
jgi:hypothetical protein